MVTPSPGSNFAVLILATLSRKGRGEEEAVASIRRQRNAVIDELVERRLDVDLGVDHARLL